MYKKSTSLKIKTNSSLLKIGIFLLGLLFFFSCSKKDASLDGTQQLELMASTNMVNIGDTVKFGVSVVGKSVDADIYVNGEKISGDSYAFDEKGNYTIIAKKENYANSNEVEVKVRQTVVYLAGQLTEGDYFNSSSKKYAAFWRDDNLQKLTDGDTYAGANALVVDKKKNVYISGTLKNKNGINVAIYWENESPEYLSDGSNDQQTTDISLDQDTVYISGISFEGNDIIAKYWKNGHSIPLTQTGKAAAQGIVSDSGKVYIVGYEENSQTIKVAKYWENKSPKNLSDGGLNASARAITISDGDIYIVGKDGAKTIVWKNHRKIETLSGNTSGIINDIAVYHGDIYLAGYKSTNSTTRNAYIWKNGTPIDLSKNGTLNNEATAIKIDYGNIYVAGTERKDNRYVALYWKNGETHKLNTAAGNSTTVNAIFINHE